MPSLYRFEPEKDVGRCHIHVDRYLYLQKLRRFFFCVVQSPLQMQYNPACMEVGTHQRKGMLSDRLRRFIKLSADKSMVKERRGQGEDQGGEEQRESLTVKERETARKF